MLGAQVLGAQVLGAQASRLQRAPQAREILIAKVLSRFALIAGETPALPAQQ